MNQPHNRFGRGRNWGGMAIAIGVGASAGTATHSFWVGAALSLVLGVVFYLAFNREGGAG